MEFPAFEWIRISRKWNISAAREQWGLGQLKCSMGRMERYKRDAYHVGKHSRPTPRLAHVIFYFCLPCDLFSIMDEAEVVRIVESTVTKKNENLLASMKSLRTWWLLKRAETFACGHRRFPPPRNQEDPRSLSSMSLIGWKREVRKINIDSTSNPATLSKRLEMPVPPVSLIKLW